jgi:hypothetical protein
MQAGSELHRMSEHGGGKSNRRARKREKKMVRTGCPLNFVGRIPAGIFNFRTSELLLALVLVPAEFFGIPKRAV